MKSQAPNPVLHRTLWAILILILLGMVGIFLFQNFKKYLALSPMVLPTYEAVTPFSLTESSGQTVTEKDLLGKVWVADFFFTSCPGPCPMMSQRMEDLQGALTKTGSKVRLVSFSIDPETDTPEVLRAYAKRYLANPDKWWFLTGSTETVQRLAVNAFKLPLSRNPDQEAPQFGKFMHSTRFVLVDTKGMIRGYYDSTDQEMIPILLRDIGLAMREQGL